MMTQPTQRIGTLDSIRGLAALYVLVFHVYKVPRPNFPPPSWLEPTIYFGYSGVWLFFVVSAFSLCLTMPRHIASGMPLMSFFISRYFRIAPLFYVLVVVTFFYVWVGLGYMQNTGIIVASVLFVNNFIPGWTAGPVQGGWAVGTEFVFYAIFPLLYFRLHALWIRLTLMAVSIVLVYWLFTLEPSFVSRAVWNDYISRSLLRHFPAFILGLMAFDFWTAHKDRPNSRIIGAVLLTLGVLLALSRPYVSIKLPPLNPTNIDSLGYALIVAGAMLYRPVALESRLLRYYGRISYSVYLWHIPVIVLLTPWLRKIFDTSGYFVTCATVIAIVTALAHVSYAVIEKPSELYGKRLIKKLTNPGLAEEPLHGRVRS